MLHNLRNDVYCRIGRSNIAGVGVIAIRPIAKGVNPFKTGIKSKEIVAVADKDVKKLPTAVKAMINDFFYKEPDGNWYIPKGGPNNLDITYYINHSNKPNLDIIDSPSDDMLMFKTNRPIKTGEELTISYASYKK